MSFGKPTLGAMIDLNALQQTRIIMRRTSKSASYRKACDKRCFRKL